MIENPVHPLAPVLVACQKEHFAEGCGVVNRLQRQHKTNQKWCRVSKYPCSLSRPFCAENRAMMGHVQNPRFAQGMTDLLLLFVWIRVPIPFRSRSCLSPVRIGLPESGLSDSFKRRKSVGLSLRKLGTAQASRIGISTHAGSERHISGYTRGSPGRTLKCSQQGTCNEQGGSGERGTELWSHQGHGSHPETWLCPSRPPKGARRNAERSCGGWTKPISHLRNPGTIRFLCTYQQSMAFTGFNLVQDCDPQYGAPLVTF